MKVRSYEELIEKCNEKIANDGFLFIAIIGEKGHGKSTLALRIAKDVLETDWNIVLKHVIFTIHDYYNIQYKNLIKDEYGRVKCIIWDDFALHSSVYRFMTSDNRFLAALIEDFEAVREDVAVFIATYATPEMVSPKLRDQANIIIDCYRKGRAKIYCKRRVLWFINKLIKTGELSFSKIPEDVYREYEELKKRAKAAKSYEIYDDEVIEKVLKRLDRDDRIALVKIKNGKSVDVDQRTLAKLLKMGLIDSHLELTPLGDQVLVYTPPLYHDYDANKFPISKTKFRALVRHIGISAAINKVDLLYDILKEVWETGKVPQLAKVRS